MRIIFFSLILITGQITIEPSLAQSSSTIPVYGVVRDTATGQPLPGVNVFVSGTTIGSASMNDGSYYFRIPRWMREVKLVASMVGFHNSIASVDAHRFSEINADFPLKEKISELGAITVRSSNKEWRKNLERFKTRLFSTTAFGRECAITNPTVLDFTFDKKSKILEARASAPIVIENQALGYRVTLYDAFLSGTEIELRWEGDLQFVELEPTSDEERQIWIENRTHAYMGSTRHFLASLMSKKLFANQFRVWEVGRPGLKFKNVPVLPQIENSLRWEPTGDRDSTYLFQFDQTLMVDYVGEPQSREYETYTVKHHLAKNRRNDQLSWARLYGAPIVIDNAGRQYTQYGMELFGQWSWERLAEQLPFNYDPEPELIKALSMDRF